MSTVARDHDRYAEMVVGLALDALEPSDEQALTQHLPGCLDCQQLLSQMQHVASAMAYGVPDAEPPASLLEGIRAGVAAHPREQHPATAPTAGVAPVSTPAPPSELGASPAVTRPTSLAAARLRRRRLPARMVVLAAAAASVVALAVVGAYAVHARSGRDAAATALASEQQVLAHLDHPGAYTVTLASGGAPTGAAVVDGQDVWLVTHDLGRNDASSSIYVLWAQNHGGQMVAVGGFDVREANLTVVHTTLPAGINRPQQFGVTHEAGRALPRTPGTAVLGTVGISA